MESSYSFEQLLDMIVTDIPLSNDDFVYGICLIGAPGSGKSTIANILSKKLNVYVTSNDKVRRLLDSIGIDSNENRSLIEQLTYARTRYMLENNTSMIIDTNFSTAYQLVEENFSHFDAKVFFVKLECR